MRTRQERNRLADKLNDICTVLRHTRPTNLPAGLAARFDGTYSDAALEAAAFIRADEPGSEFHIPTDPFDMREVTEAYVASAAWLSRHAPDHVEAFIQEVVREAGITVEGWNEACEALQDYADRKAFGPAPDFAALRVVA